MKSALMFGLTLVVAFSVHAQVNFPEAARSISTAELNKLWDAVNQMEPLEITEDFAMAVAEYQNLNHFHDNPTFKQTADAWQNASSNDRANYSDEFKARRWCSLQMLQSTQFTQWFSIYNIQVPNLDLVGPAIRVYEKVVSHCMAKETNAQWIKTVEEELIPKINTLGAIRTAVFEKVHSQPQAAK